MICHGGKPFDTSAQGRFEHLHDYLLRGSDHCVRDGVTNITQEGKEEVKAGMAIAQAMATAMVFGTAVMS
ncbi:hypothetical protein AK812_SmicGene6053 [Symbiodinium microadriaticum]|uniref:Uncharacterized protein n=1 Tax=Symbiodinium microadriaticum TaxID=2951 RepID=A0A1Q9ES76_SYMMI|nr:hypothetical protein AK812_SmicGene6053 [Symbiodinium microadriaticum]